MAASIRRDAPLAAMDVCAVLPAYLGPLVLRFDGAVPDSYWRNFWEFIPVAVAYHFLLTWQGDLLHAREQAILETVTQKAE